MRYGQSGWGQTAAGGKLAAWSALWLVLLVPCAIAWLTLTGWDRVMGGLKR